jgi:hypothetical protein
MMDQTSSPARYVPNYLVQAILTTIFCCLPFGIVAIVFAAQVNGKLAAGDYAGATQTSNQAKMWCWIAFGIGLVCQVIPFILWLLFVGFAVSQGHAIQPRHF